MELISYSFWKRNQLKAIFSRFSSSIVTFRFIGSYYFVYSVRWSENDPIVIKSDLEEMEWLINRELGLETRYQQRKRAHQ